MGWNGVKGGMGWYGVKRGGVAWYVVFGCNGIHTSLIVNRASVSIQRLIFSEGGSASATERTIAGGKNDDRLVD